jgi:hypothetical protein
MRKEGVHLPEGVVEWMAKEMLDAIQKRRH